MPKIKAITFAASIVAACSPAFAQGALDILDRAQSSSSRSWGNTLDNAHQRTQMDQIQQENAWYNRCMYQTGGDHQRCTGIRQTQIQPRQRPRGEPARLVDVGGYTRSVTNVLVRQCTYEIRGQTFMRLYEDCPNEIYIQ